MALYRGLPYYVRAHSIGLMAVVSALVGAIALAIKVSLMQSFEIPTGIDGTTATFGPLSYNSPVLDRLVIGSWVLAAVLAIVDFIKRRYWPTMR